LSSTNFWYGIESAAVGEAAAGVAAGGALPDFADGSSCTEAQAARRNTGRKRKRMVMTSGI
jgi:hypothetical protein